MPASAQTIRPPSITWPAQKQKKITPEDEKRAIDTMCQLNDIGSNIAKIEGINAITDAGEQPLAR
jgi:selenophosphate synthase